jgi:hypothetical protein
MYVCMYVYIYVCTCMYVWMDVCMYIYIYICMYAGAADLVGSCLLLVEARAVIAQAGLHTHTHTHTHTHMHTAQKLVHTRTYIMCLQ